MREHEVAVIVGGGAGVSASCARLLASEGMKVAIAARTPGKPALQQLKIDNGVSVYGCDAADEESVANLFHQVKSDLGNPTLVVHNIDGRTPSVFRKEITEVAAEDVKATLMNSTYSAFLVAQQAARCFLDNEIDDYGRGTMIFTNASAALKGFPKSGAFAAACHGKAGLAQSMARELMPQGVHVANCPIDCAIGVTQEDGSRQHWAAGETTDDNMADPDYIAQAYLQIHRQHRSTWTNEVVLRPWTERW